MAGEKRDYYEILEVDRKASAREIRSAYRRLAAKYHPDVDHDETAGERFKEINAAHEVLSTPDKRRKYDRANPVRQRRPFENDPRVAAAAGSRCDNHPSRFADQSCDRCRRPFCADCLDVVDRRPVCQMCSGTKSARIRWRTVGEVLLVLTVIGVLIVLLLMLPAFWRALGFGLP
jgi:hypothetical protein